jgi:micrococcal nuclease
VVLPVVSVVLVLAAAGGAAGVPEPQNGLVDWVYDGDTISVRLDGGRREKVRLIGIDTPEFRECYHRESSAETRRLALQKRVVLQTDPTQGFRDRYGRRLAYVWVPGGGRDLGVLLLERGFARLFVLARDPFRRLSVYRGAEARGRGRGLWSACR